MNITYTAFSRALNEHMQKRPEGYLYHYTSAEGLKGILTEKKVWCSPHFYLNDSQENQHFIDILRQEAKANYGLGDQTEVTRNLELLERVVDSNIEYGKHIYTASFTEKEDDLSQWRAYCPTSGGYCLGIPADHLNKLIKHYDKFGNLESESVSSRKKRYVEARNKDFINWQWTEPLLVQCIYDDEKKRKIARELLPVAFESGAGSEDSSVRRISDYCRKLAPIFKHEAFEDEAEWRLIVPESFFGSEGDQLGFRQTDAGLKVYGEFSLEVENLPFSGGSQDQPSWSPNQIPKVICGPTPNMDGSLYAVRKLFRARNYQQRLHHPELNDYQSYVLPSQVPYQTWNS